MNATVAGLAAVLLYLLASGLLGQKLLHREKLPAALVLGLGSIALPLHLIAVHSSIYQANGLDLGIFHMVSLVSWLIATLTIAMSLYQPVVSLTLGAYPLAALGILLSLFVSAPYTALATLSRGAESHILLSVLAYGVLTLAAAQSVLLAIQDRHLRQRKQGLLNHLPPLQTMERLLFDLIAVGFVLLTLSIATGFMTLEDMFAQHVAHKTILTMAAWAVFAVLLIGRYWRGWRGAMAIRFTLWGFALLVVGFFGSKLVLEIILKRPI